MIRPELVWTLRGVDQRNLASETWLDFAEDPYRGELIRGHPVNRYYDGFDLRTLIAEFEGVDVGQVAVANGGRAVLTAIFKLVLGPARSIYICSPTFYAPSSDSTRLGFSVHDVPLIDNERLDMKRLLRIADEKRVTFERAQRVRNWDEESDGLLDLVENFKVQAEDWWTWSRSTLYICNPNNPVGNLYPEEQLAELISKWPALVILDEVFLGFTDNPGFVSRLDEFPNLVVVKSLSKDWGRAAHRVGWAIASQESVARGLNRMTIGELSVASAQAAAEALTNPEAEKIRREQVKGVRIEAQRIYSELKELSFVAKAFPTTTNCLFFELNVSPARVVDWLKQEHGIHVNGGSFSTAGRVQGLRISVGTTEENNRLIESLKAFDHHHQTGVDTRWIGEPPSPNAHTAPAISLDAARSHDPPSNRGIAPH